MNEHETEFDDPGFKAAVRRTVGREAAPPSLRAKVQSLLIAEAAAAATAGSGASGDAGDANGHADPASTPASTPAAAPSRGRRRLVIDRAFWRTAAAAAIVLIALGFMAYQIRENVFPPGTVARGGASVTVPQSVVVDLTRTHDACAKLPDHHIIPGDKPDALREKLTAGSGVTASTVSLGGDWKFKGAGVCRVGDIQAAHLLFARADEYVSVFSMSVPEECGYGTDAYATSFEKHPVTGFRHGNALYCVVGSNTKREMTKDELGPVLTKVQGSVVTGCMSHDTMIAAASAAPGQHQH